MEICYNTAIMKTEEAVAVDYRTAFEDEPLVRQFSRLLEDRISIADTIKSLEEEKKALDTRLTEMMLDSGQRKLHYEGRPVSIVAGSRSNLNKERLLKYVTSSQLTECTDVTSYEYLLIGKRKD